MRKLIYILMTMPLFIASCSNDDMAVSEEIVEVNFCAELPQRMGTRATSTLSVDKVYCAVFEDGEEITALREDIDIVEGEPIVFAPRLIRGRTYDIAFWASTEGAYNVSNMEAIQRINDQPEAKYDAFTANATITVEGNHSEEVNLYRPLAQLNMGVTSDDWNAVKDPATFNMRPATISLSIADVKTSFNALTGNAFGSTSETMTYTLSISGVEFVVNGNTYKNIAQCYVLMDEIRQNDKGTFNLTYSIYDQLGKVIRENAEIIHVPLQANHKTNVVGGLLTGVVNYEITLDGNGIFNEDDHIEKID